MKSVILIFSLLMFFLPIKGILSQDDNRIELTQEQWKALRDDYAVMTIKLLSKLDSLNNQIDSLKSILPDRESFVVNCENELYALLGTNREGVSDFRKKFSEAEKIINNRTGTPADVKQTYFDEISASNIKCLPEFSDRFNSLKKKFEDWAGTETQTPQEVNYTIEGTYTVKPGDWLSKIALKEYNSVDLWPAIWDANKNGVYNKDFYMNNKFQSIQNPDLIFPGQILKIPSLNKEKKN